MIGEQAGKYLLYFILGGGILTLVTYFGSRKEGLIAAFFAMFPVVTVLTLFTIYSEAGADAIEPYVKGLLILTPLWVLYLLSVIFLLPRYGFWIALALGVAIYLFAALIIFLWS